MYMTCHRYTESAHKSVCPKCAIRRYYTGRSNCPLQIRASGPQSAVSFFSSKHNVCCGAGEQPHSIAFVDSTSAWRRGAFWPRIMTWRVLTLSVITLYSRGVCSPGRRTAAQPFLFAPLRRGVAFEHNFPRLLSQWKCAYRSIADEGIDSAHRAD